MSYLKVKEAKLIKTIGVNPIYECSGKFYVGLETLNNMDEEIENCIDCDSLAEAELNCEELTSMTN